MSVITSNDDHYIPSLLLSFGPLELILSTPSQFSFFFFCTREIVIGNSTNYFLCDFPSSLLKNVLFLEGEGERNIIDELPPSRPLGYHACNSDLESS